MLSLEGILELLVIIALNCIIKTGADVPNGIYVSMITELTKLGLLVLTSLPGLKQHAKTHQTGYCLVHIPLN